MLPYIEIQTPQPWDIVGPRDLIVAGQNGTFEGAIAWTLQEGHDELRGVFSGQAFGIGQFSGTISADDIDASAMKVPRLFLTLSHAGPSDDPDDFVSTTIPVIWGPLMVDGYEGWIPVTVAAGDTLSSLAESHLGDPDLWPVLHTANQHIVPDPDLIFAGQQLRVPFVVS